MLLFPHSHCFNIKLNYHRHKTTNYSLSNVKPTNNLVSLTVNYLEEFIPKIVYFF